MFVDETFCCHHQYIRSSSYPNHVNNNAFYRSDSEEEVGNAPIVYGNYFDSSDEEEKQEAATIVVLAAVAATIIMSGNNTQGPSIRHVRDRLEWDLHVRQLELEEGNAFRRFYRMSYASFVKLCTWINPFLTVDNKMSRIRTGKGPISMEIALHCLLRWLSGGSYLDIRLSAGISKASFYRVVYECATAILQAEQLQYSFPSSNDELNQDCSDFKAISSNGVIDGCVACLDGMLLQIQTPTAAETGHVKLYFSGHYQTYGINVQAACDAHCRFVFASLAAPGGTNDIVAFRKTSLLQKITSLPIGKYVIGDNAYVCSENLLTPFSGQQRLESAKDSYNFYLSQLRIRIEMTFGRSVNKWGLFKRPLQIRLKNVGIVFMCATRLHNFCINEQSSTVDLKPLAMMKKNRKAMQHSWRQMSMLFQCLVTP
jgi:hypothetical protein